MRDEMVIPAISSSIKPHQDLPLECLPDFNKAAAVRSASPRAASALMRACMEKLLYKLTGKENASDAIKKLVADGLSSRVQQAMDVVRITGNEALHANTITSDGSSPADFDSLVNLMHLIVEQCITRPAQEAKLFEALPPKAHVQIKRRDGN